MEDKHKRAVTCSLASEGNFSAPDSDNEDFSSESEDEGLSIAASNTDNESTFYVSSDLEDDTKTEFEGNITNDVNNEVTEDLEEKNFGDTVAHGLKLDATQGFDDDKQLVDDVVPQY